MQETQETWVQPLGQEDALEKEMATHSKILAWEIPWTVEPGRLQSKGSQKSWTWLKLTKHTTPTFYILLFTFRIFFNNLPILIQVDLVHVLKL